MNASCFVCALTVGSLLFNGCRWGWKNHHFWIKLSICPSIFAAFLKKQRDSPSSIQLSQSAPRVWMNFFFFFIVLHCISYSVIFPDDCSPLNALQEWLWESRLIHHLFNDSQSFSAVAGHFWLTCERCHLEESSFRGDRATVRLKNTLTSFLLVFFVFCYSLKCVV